MIEAIEALLLAALAPLPLRFPGLALRAGPGAPPIRGSTVSVWALGLQHSPRDTPGAERASPRLGARLGHLLADTSGCWLLDGMEDVELTDVLGPDGQVLIRDDDWTVEAAGPGRVRLRLRAPLPAGAAPVVWARGAWARGFRSTGACVVELSLVALAERAAEADAAMGAALALGLPVLAALPAVEAPWGSFPELLPPGAGVRARLEAPQVTLRGQTRGWSPGSPGLARVESLLTLSGVLELEVALGAPDASAVISTIVGTVDGATIDIA